MERIAVYGTGTIGSCEATLITGHGIPCVVIGHSEQGLERCRRTIAENWDDLIRQGMAEEKNKRAAMELLTISSDPAELKGCTFVFEAVAEDLAVKKSVYEKILQHADDSVIIASCTSSINLPDLLKTTDRPEQLLIAHPFQPVHMLPLVEVMRHEGNPDQVIARTLSLLKQLHRETVLLRKSVPGMIVNRLAQALFRESIDLIEQGVTTAEDIDLAVKYAVGMRYASIGLLEYFDAVGFELEKAIADIVYPELCDTKDIQRTVLDGIAAGATGQKAGRGLFDWSEKDADDFRMRKQSPYFDGVRKWTMPE
ncbi:MAG: 3-hydroxyacyl-CoA dehydrogenase family protein [Eubacterium sp.]|nr:3-hydroxyacyl-CoA dehydrogenase family protein [Eubacterium sp.]